MDIIQFTIARPTGAPGGVYVLEKSGHYIIGYSIMPNHVHAVIAFHNTGKTINSIAGNGKKIYGL
jgi:hypothetical protein